MLTGVYFRRGPNDEPRPEFVNAFILTDLYINALTSTHLRRPLIPSIAVLSNPASPFITIVLQILRTILLIILSRLPGSAYIVEKISVANTSITYHDGRALATCESGPPIRVNLPALETVGWFDGRTAEGEEKASVGNSAPGLGEKDWVLGFMKKWTTAHVRRIPL